MDGKLLTATAAAVEVAAQDGGDPPREIMLMPRGVVTTRAHDGRPPWKNEDAAAVAKRTNAIGGELVIDYDHQGTRARDNGKPAPAAGWIKRAFERAGAVWGEVEWTANAKRFIQGREYRFISPVFSYRKKDREVMAITGAGLTNDPAFVGLADQALANAGGDNEVLDELCSLLGLPMTSGKERVKSTVRMLMKKAGMDEGKDMAAVAVASAVQTGRISDEQVEWATAFAERAPGEFEEFIAAAPPVRATAAVDAAIRDGRLPPSLREWAEASAARDLGDFERFLDAAPDWQHLRGARATPRIEAKRDEFPVPVGYDVQGTELVTAATEIAKRDGVDMAVAVTRAAARS